MKILTLPTKLILPTIVNLTFCSITSCLLHNHTFYTTTKTFLSFIGNKCQTLDQSISGNCNEYFFVSNLLSSLSLYLPFTNKNSFVMGDEERTLCLDYRLEVHSLGQEEKNRRDKKTRTCHCLQMQHQILLNPTPQKQHLFTLLHFIQSIFNSFSYFPFITESRNAVTKV